MFFTYIYVDKLNKHVYFYYDPGTFILWISRSMLDLGLFLIITLIQSIFTILHDNRAQSAVEGRFD